MTPLTHPYGKNYIESENSETNPEYNEKKFHMAANQDVLMSGSSHTYVARTRH